MTTPSKGENMSDFMKGEQVFVDQDLPTREKTLSFIANKAVKLGFSDDQNAVYNAFLEREAIGETGMNDGFAVPHAKTKAISRAGIIMVKLRQPVEWPSFDGNPVDVAMALLVPDSEAGTTHLRLLSRSAVMLMSEEFRDAVHASNEPEVIAALINAGIEG